MITAIILWALLGIILSAGGITIMHWKFWAVLVIVSVIAVTTIPAQNNTEEVNRLLALVEQSDCITKDK